MVFKLIKLEEYDFETEIKYVGIDCAKFKQEMNMFVIKTTKVLPCEVCW